ncbi:general transcription factor IIF subunit 2-like [Haliotis cracherodii]|uniref:general transcription factor IIF subunit 2-like n=1 Tax=Haliotis cracherodii TaxID=6455 RepID=UPI0039ED2217
MQSVDKAHETREVDLSAAPRGVWLVKVPKYLSERWQKAQGGSEVGKLRITRPKSPGLKPDVMFSSHETMMKAEPGQAQAPRDHKFVLTGVGVQNLVVMSQTPIFAKDGNGATKEKVSERVAVEGKVLQRAECRPIADDNYNKLKRLHWEIQNKPKREVIQLSGVVQSYKPRSAYASLDGDKRKKEESKRSRLDREKVQDMLFNAFEKHQYYNVKDLVKITNQPVPYLKEILKEICTYNMKAPHRNMWELKPEYRHYKEQNTS